MLNNISRCMLIQNNFMSRCYRVRQHEMVLYNKMPQSFTSLVELFVKDKNKLYQSNEALIKAKTIGNYPEILYQSVSSYLNLYTDYGSTNIPVVGQRNDKQTQVLQLNVLNWFAKTDDPGRKDPKQTGPRIGRLDAAHEAGFFHRADRSRLKELKEKLKLKKKGDSKPTEPKKPA